MRNATKSTVKTKRPNKGQQKVQVTKVRAAKGPQVVQEDTLKISPTTKVRPASVRQTIRSLIAAGKATPEIAAVLQAQFPLTQAAKKAGKHIAYYRAELKAELATV